VDVLSTINMSPFLLIPVHLQLYTKAIKCVETM